MSAFSGRQGRGAMRRRRAAKREQAEIRNELYQERIAAEAQEESE